MDWNWVLPALAGFALGLLSAYVVLLVQRNWQKKDDADYSMKVVGSLIAEIEEGIGRAKYMAELLDKNQVSFSRVYTALWESTNQRLAATLSDPEVLALLHRIYYRFDLINFNCQTDRPGAGGAFAKEYLPEVENNLSKLKALVHNG